MLHVNDKLRLETAKIWSTQIASDRDRFRVTPVVWMNLFPPPRSIARLGTVKTLRSRISSCYPVNWVGSLARGAQSAKMSFYSWTLPLISARASNETLVVHNNWKLATQVFEHRLVTSVRGSFSRFDPVDAGHVCSENREIHSRRIVMLI